jgi:hypothetical protein
VCGFVRFGSNAGQCVHTSCSGPEVRHGLSVTCDMTVNVRLIANPSDSPPTLFFPSINKTGKSRREPTTSHLFRVVLCLLTVGRLLSSMVPSLAGCASILLAWISCRAVLGFRAEHEGRRCHNYSGSTSCRFPSHYYVPLQAPRVKTTRRVLAKLRRGPTSSRRSTNPGPLSGAADGREDDITDNVDARIDEAGRLLQQASALRKQAEEASERLSQKQPGRKRAGASRLTDSLAEIGGRSGASRTTATTNVSPFVLPPPPAVQGTDEAAAVSYDYRLHVDIGREPGSWMEPRWGASGRRIEFTLDVRFTDKVAEDGGGDGATRIRQHASSSLVKGGTTLGWLGSKQGSECTCFALETAPYARMRSGFDRMRCLGGVYRIERDSNKPKSDGAVRFCILVDGTTDYGDVTIPPGYLYFSIPAFSSNLSLISRKPGPVTVRQAGWNTGWRREESRIVGVFVATPLADKRS